jgi:hypothetical protein
MKVYCLNRNRDGIRNDVFQHVDVIVADIEVVVAQDDEVFVVCDANGCIALVIAFRVVNSS